MSSSEALKGQGTERPPASAAASASALTSAPAPAPSAGTSSSLVASANNSSPPTAATVDAFSALITPTKAVYEEQQQQASKKEKQRQLQLAVDSASKVVLKGNNQKKKRSSTAAVDPAAPAEATRASSVKWPPVSSAKSLPPLSGRASDLLRGEQASADAIEFEVNQECTSIGLVPSGRIAVAGFTDGTLRLFDLTGIFAKDRNHPHSKEASSELFDDDASSSSSEDSFQSASAPGVAKNAKSMSVDSRSNQRYGAVACQIHARGVHNRLLMDVAVSEDGLYAFGGVQRGSVELAAVYLGDVEGYLDGREKETSIDQSQTPGILDLVQVDRHADAKLKGFGACTRLWNGWERVKGGEKPEYLLFTGKGIKNIHIWSYKPSRKDDESIWTCLYDTPGNGTSINQLYFRHNLHGSLQAISKSDDMKLRVWDLKYEQKRVAEGRDGSDRPKRPDYVDVASTEGTIGVCGPYAFASGSLGGMHNIINVVGLDADDVSSPFNRTELALPSADAGGEYLSSRPSRTGRQQRGDLKSVVNVAGLSYDAGHVLLQLSDGSVVHYLHDQSGHPLLLQSSSSLCTTSIDDDASFGSLAGTNNQHKRMSLARVGSQGMVLFAVSSFNENTSRGALLLRALPGSYEGDAHGSKQRKYWGFNGLKKKRKHAVSRASSSLSGPAAEAKSTPAPGLKSNIKTSSVKKVDPSPAPHEASNANKPEVKDSQLVESTPAPAAKDKKKTKPSGTKAAFQSAKSVRPGKHSTEDVADLTPAPVNQDGGKKDDGARKVTPGDLISPAPQPSQNAKDDVSNRPGKKRLSDKDAERMDSQLESIVRGYSQESVHSPKRPSGSDKDTNQTAAKKQKIAQAPEPAEKPVASSPKRRSRKKAATPKPSPAKDDLPVPREESDTRQLGFIGMTILDKKVSASLPETCYQPKARPQLLVEQLPKTTVGSRLAEVPVVPSPFSPAASTAASKESVHFKWQCDERQKLAAKHRAEHEMVRKRVLHSVRSVLSTWDVEVGSKRSRASIIESARRWFDEALAGHQEMLNDMLDRQMLEVESLAARQTLELREGRAPPLQVTFPFPEVFDQARKELLSILK